MAEGFAKRWNFEHTLGAIDGKHVRIRLPRGAVSAYYNYKGFYSLILMAVVDSNYRFLYLDVGAEGRAGDAGVFNACTLAEAINENTLGIPPHEPLPNDNLAIDVPYFFIADDAFALKHWLIKPFQKRNMTRPERIFNYRLSRARRIVENAFGILSHRFRCLLTTLQQEPPIVKDIILACCTLHNFLCIRNPAMVAMLVVGKTKMCFLTCDHLYGCEGLPPTLLQFKSIGRIGWWTELWVSNLILKIFTKYCTFRNVYCIFILLFK